MTPLLWTGIACAAVLAAVGLWAWLWRTPRVWPFDTDELPSVRGQCPPPDDDFDAHASQALDVIAEPDRRRAEHMNRTLRQVEGGDERG